MQMTKYSITAWGGEKSPILCHIEPEFGMDGYQGILKAETLILRKKIDKDGVGKEGEKYAQAPLSTPVATPLLTSPETIKLKNCPPKWLGRYTPVYSSPKTTATWKLFLSSRLIKQTKRSIKAFYKNIVWRIRPPLEKIQSLDPVLLKLLREKKHLVCMAKPFWFANKRLIMEFFSKETTTILDHMHAPLELQQSLAVPLYRFNDNSLESLLSFQHVCDKDNFLIIMYEHQAAEVIRLFAKTGKHLSSALIISDEPYIPLRSEWTITAKLGKNLWLANGLKYPQSKGVPSQSSLRKWPKISIVVVSYNQVSFIKDCLDSILNQNYPRLECIVVDGQSTDGTVDILESYRSNLARLIIEPDRCQSDALNKGFRLATGDIMTWVCSDDFLEQKALFNVAEAFDKHQTDLVAGGCRIIKETGENICNHHNGFPVGKVSKLSFGDLISFIGAWERGLYFYQPDLFFSKKIWEKSGAYIKEHLHFAMDYDLFLRFAMAGAKIIHIPQYLATRRIHDHQKTRHETMTYLPTIRNLMMEYQALMAAVAQVNNAKQRD